MTDGKPGPQGSGEGDRTQASEAPLSVWRLLGEVLERLFDRAAKLLQGGASIGTRCRQASTVSQSSCGKSGRSLRSGRVRVPIARAVAAGVERRFGCCPLQLS